MGTDFRQLFDAKTADILARGTADDLCAFVDSRAGLAGSDKPRIWGSYFDLLGRQIDLGEFLNASQRLEALLKFGWGLQELREELVNDLCLSSEWLHVDYWGCMAEVFGDQPPGSLPLNRWWRARGGRYEDEEISYILTDDNVSAIRESLGRHRSELTIMDDRSLDQLRCWAEFCGKQNAFRVVYNIDV